MGINFYYHQAIIKGTLVIDFVSADSWLKKYILEILVPVNSNSNIKSFLSNRYFYFEKGQLKGVKIKNSKIKNIEIIKYTQLDNTEVPKPILNFI